jgi:excisionase family DNA binding protein
MNRDEVDRLTRERQETLSVVDAGKVLGLGRFAAYQAAATGELPTLRIGRRILVPRRQLERLLEGDR